MDEQRPRPSALFHASLIYVGYPDENLEQEYLLIQRPLPPTPHKNKEMQAII